MSLSDTLMWRYLELLSAKDMRTIEKWKREVSEGANPRDVKLRLAAELVARFHGDAAAKRAQESFVARFQKGQLPDDMPEVELAAAGKAVPLPPSAEGSRPGGQHLRGHAPDTSGRGAD